MQLVRYTETGGPAVLKLENADKPRPGAGEVLIKSEAIGVAFAEVQLRQGTFVGGPTPVPRAPGADVAGTVDAIGDGVTNAKVGDRVVSTVAQGGYADYAIAVANDLQAIPDQLTAAQAVVLFPTAGQVAFHALKTMGHLYAGESVLIHAAAGGIGHLAVQIAKVMGAGKVIAAANSQAKLDFARSLGADSGVNYGNEGWVDEVRKVTGGKGVDLVLHSSGATILKQSMSVIAPLGRLVFYGWASDGSGGGPTVSLIDLLLGLKYATGLKLGGLQASRPEEVSIGKRQLLEYVAQGKVRPIVHASLPLAESAKAHEILESRSQLGRVVLVP